MCEPSSPPKLTPRKARNNSERSCDNNLQDSTEKQITPQSTPGKSSRVRGKKCVVGSTEESPNVMDSPMEGRRSSRRRPYDHIMGEGEGEGGWRCVVAGCSFCFDTRAARQFHVRHDHPELKVEMETASSHGLSSPPMLKRHDDIKIEEGHMMHQMIMQQVELIDGVEVEMESDEDPGYNETSDEEEQEERRKRAHGEIRDEDGNIIKRGRGRPRKGPMEEPGPRSRLRIGDPEGRYECYVDGCDWRGRYRSVRSAHMKAMHSNWVRPPNYVLNRVSRHGELLVPPCAEEDAKFECLVEGCPWRGNYRASRTAHIRNHHKDVIFPRCRPSSEGGYVENGKYACHAVGCDWRGASRSTRSTHMRRKHANFINTVYSARNVPCCDCPASLQSHKLFVDHMVCEHNVGGIVQREFSDPRDYEEWFDAVQDSFTIDFIKRMGVKQTQQYQVLYLYCARGGGVRDPRINRYGRGVSRALRRNQRGGIPKCGKNCAAFLRVLNWSDGRLTVIGCVEHTGHRMGTPLLRLSQNEREVMDEFLYVCDPSQPLEIILDRLREHDGFQVDGFDAQEKTEADVAKYIMDEMDELDSLRSIVHSDEWKDSVFAVHIPAKGESPETLSIGMMTERQRELWRNHNKVVCIEEVRLVLNAWDMRVFLVIVFDQSETPRCCAILMTCGKDRSSLIRHLYKVCPSPPETVVTDCSPDWEELLESVYGEAVFNMDLQLAEWHLLSEWAALCDQLVSNRVDRFSIMCTLRRWIRASEPILFEAMVTELFDALREMELDELASFLDNQLTAQNFAKRWTPVNRHPLTEHNNPILELACRTLREKFLACECCKRLDEYVGLLFERIAEFNESTMGPLYTTGNPDPPRQVPQEWEDDPRYLQLLESSGLDDESEMRRQHKEDKDMEEMLMHESFSARTPYEEIVVEESEVTMAHIEQEEL